MAILLGKETAASIHPKYWPYCDSGEGGVHVYQATSRYDADGGAFWGKTSDSTFGAVNTATKSANTYYTYVDITGSHGAMGTIILPQIASNASAFYTIKLTTDGVEEEFKTPTATLSANRRRWLGFAKENAGGTDVRNQSEGGYGLYRFHKENIGIDSYSYGGTLRSAQDMVVQGLPVHTFETSLKLEAKCSVASSGDGYKLNGGVLVYSLPNI